jgi:hypothetical protein
MIVLGQTLRPPKPCFALTVARRRRPCNSSASQSVTLLPAIPKNLARRTGLSRDFGAERLGVAAAPIWRLVTRLLLVWTALIPDTWAASAIV